jgi:predicted transcriptional regulator
LSELNSRRSTDVGARSSRITINLSPALQAELRSLAEDERRSLSSLCLQLIEASLTLRKRPN